MASRDIISHASAETPAVAVSQSPKNEYIETLRGLAILLVVAGHVIGIDARGGMRVADDSIWRYLYDSLHYVCMPLFTAISGWVYALYPVRSSFGVFMFKKAQRLLLPLVFVGTLYFFVQYFMPGTNVRGDLSQLWRIYVFPYTIYWYLPALFLIFAGMVFIDLRGWASHIRSWGVWLLVSCFLAVAGNLLATCVPNVFAIWNAMCMFPFFVLGVGIKRFSAVLLSPFAKRVYLIAFCMGVAVHQWVWFSGQENEFVRSWYLHIPIGIFSSAFLLSLNVRNRLLVSSGAYAYTMYLFHGFGTSAGRIIFQRVGIDSSLAIFLFSLLLGLALPVVVDKVFSRFRLPALLFLGKSPKTKK